MDIVDSYPVVVTEQLREFRDFYTRWLSFEVLFEATWFVLVNSGPVSVAFMHPEHPSSPPTPGVYSGDGAFLTLQVADARSYPEPASATSSVRKAPSPEYAPGVGGDEGCSGCMNAPTQARY